MPYDTWHLLVRILSSMFFCYRPQSDSVLYFLPYTWLGPNDE